MGVVVELCGLPGAGKSTLARAVVARLRLAGLPTVDVMAPLGPSAARGARSRRKAAVLARALAEPGSLRIAADLASRSGQQAWRDRVARPVNLLVVRHEVAKARTARGYHVLDQGPVQEWWSAALRADAERVLAWAATDPAPRADLVVRIDAPTEALVARLTRRAVRQSRLEGLDRGALAAELERGRELLDVVCGQLVHSPGTPQTRVLRVGGLEPGAADLVTGAVRALG